MAKYKLVDLETEKEFELEDFDANKRFVIKVNCRNIQPSDIPKYIKTLQQSVGDFFGDVEKVLFVPVRDSGDFSVFEVRVEEDDS